MSPNILLERCAEDSNLYHQSIPTIFSNIDFNTNSYLFNDVNVTTYVWGGIFPILEQAAADTVSCPPAAKPYVLARSGNDVAIKWDTDQEHQLWQISFGPADVPPDSNNLFTNVSTTRTLGPLDTAVHYAAYVRGQCHHHCAVHDTILWGPWSDSLGIFIGAIADTASSDTTATDTTSADTTGIRLTLADQLTRLFPNPASQQVTVASSLGIASVDLFDLKGTLRLHQSSDPSAHTITLDIAALDKGTYLIVISTPAGTTVKRLVVQ